MQCGVVTVQGILRVLPGVHHSPDGHQVETHPP
jgi:hypothetical protein